MESSNSAKLKPVNVWCSIFAAPPPIAGDSISPEVVMFLIARILGIGSSVSSTPGTRVGSENDSERIIITVSSVRLLARGPLVFFALFL